MPPGQPPKYKDPEEMQKKIEKYFSDCPDKRPIYNKDGNKVGEVPELTITGLVLYLGFCDRASFYDYGKREAFSHTIKKARSLIEKEYEILLKRGLGAGAIFALKNFGWTDTSQLNQHDDRLEEELEFVGVPSQPQNGRFKKFYN